MFLRIANLIRRNRNITLLNLHASLQRFSNKTLDVFGGVYFLTHGVSFTAIALMWAASFAIRFVLRPLSLWFTARVGLKTSLIVGTLISSGLFLIFTQVDGLNYWLLIFAIYLAFYDILYWLPYNAFYAVAGEEHDRGKQIAMGTGLINAVQIIAPLAGAGLAASYGFSYLYIAATVCMILSITPILFSRDVSPGRRLNVQEALREVDKRGLVMAIGDGVAVNGGEFLWTMVMFLLVGNLVDFGGLVTLALFLSTVLSLAIGYFIDRGSMKIMALTGTGILVLSTLGKSLWAGNVPQIITVNAVGAVGSAFYEMAYGVSIYNFAKRTHNTLWFHFFAEAGWDIGGIIICLIAAALVTLGVSLQHTILITTAGYGIVWRVLRPTMSSGNQL